LRGLGTFRGAAIQGRHDHQVTSLKAKTLLLRDSSRGPGTGRCASFSEPSSSGFLPVRFYCLALGWLMVPLGLPGDCRNLRGDSLVEEESVLREG